MVSNLTKLRRELKRMGYKVKIENTGWNRTFYSGNIYKDGEWVYGADASVYTEEQLRKHRRAIDTVKKWVEKGITYRGYEVHF